MSHRSSPLAVGLLIASCAHEASNVASGAAGAEPVRGVGGAMPAGFAGVMLPPGDAEAAIRSEFAEVERRGTSEGYDVFAERHRGHPLAKEALQRAQAIRANGPG